MKKSDKKAYAGLKITHGRVVLPWFFDWQISTTCKFITKTPKKTSTCFGDAYRRL